MRSTSLASSAERGWNPSRISISRTQGQLVPLALEGFDLQQDRFQALPELIYRLFDVCAGRCCIDGGGVHLGELGERFGCRPVAFQERVRGQLGARLTTARGPPDAILWRQRL